MKNFDIPTYYRSPIISRIKALRKAKDPRKKDFEPTVLNFGNIQFYIARHFGFCYGVENAIEIAYRAIEENPTKRIFLLSQMIHNPSVNEDLKERGLHFLQDTNGRKLIDWNTLSQNDIVIIPAFGASIEIMEKLNNIGVNIKQYNTTCPFVEKVWNRSEKLGIEGHTVIIHGKYNHEETRATFSHSSSNSPSLVIKNLEETKILADFILKKRNIEDFYNIFNDRYSKNFDPQKDLNKIGVVNQTTMLATETQEITEYLRKTMIEKYGIENVKQHIADTRDTLCYATTDNQSSTYKLMETNAHIAIVVGGYNSSNTTHLVELLEQKFPTYFIANANEILSNTKIQSFNIHTKKVETHQNYMPKQPINIAITSGASCPDVVVDRVIQRLLELSGYHKQNIEETLNKSIC